MLSRFKLLFAISCAVLLQAQRPQIPAPAATGPGLSYGTILYGEPVVADLVRPGVVPVGRGTVVAEQRVQIMGARMTLDRPLTIGAPFDYELRGERSAFRRYRTPAGDRWCWSGIPGVAFRPPRDERGEIFPGVCLRDADGDGAFETVRMLPYPPRTEPRDVAIAPVRLLAAPPPADPRISRLHVFRRIRIAEISEGGIVLVLEHAWLPQGRGAPDYAQDGPSERVTLALRPGASASIAGLALRVQGGPGARRIAAGGTFEPWVALEQGATAVRLGPYFLPPRED